ncbi:MAG TPA: PfkB family carbohydrate kinase [Gemmataceae bacterium]|jgi:sugar/nucleoside kinase (ribokinase family)|nr:PfkB family carbohydrate kinase [Gemmataceae bacterium]
MPGGSKHSLLVVGSVAFDSIETPNGSVDDALGGSATYFSYAASFFLAPRLVAPVGEDFPDEHRRMFASRGIDAAGLVTLPGQTFRWKGRYHQDMNTRDTLEVHLNVLGSFQPDLPESFRDSTHIFLANSGPALQASVLEQIRRPQLVLADTMDLWIETERTNLLALLPRIDGLLLNDSEAKLLTGDDNIVRAGKAVRRLGPKFVILKKGEHGAMLFMGDDVFVMPAYPTENVIDPTGAGDTFAGGILGFLAADDQPAPGRLRDAMAYGTVLASLTVEGFGLDRLKRADRAEVDARFAKYRAMLTF